MAPGALDEILLSLNVYEEFMQCPFERYFLFPLLVAMGTRVAYHCFIRDTEHYLRHPTHSWDSGSMSTLRRIIYIAPQCDRRKGSAYSLHFLFLFCSPVILTRCDFCLSYFCCTGRMSRDLKDLRCLFKGASIYTEGAVSLL